MKIGILIGSASDLDIVKDSLGILKEFEVPFILEVTSAHRTPERTVDLIRRFEDQGAEVLIAVAGKAAHLGGFIAAHTILPVIGIPAGGGSLGGLDSLLSTVQMPKGVPVACMGIGKAGAANAVILAIQILSLKDMDLREKLQNYRKKMKFQVQESSEKIQKDL